MVCAVFFACHIVSVGIFSKSHDPIVLTILQFGVAGILCLLTAFTMKTSFNPMINEHLTLKLIIGSILVLISVAIAEKPTKVKILKE